MIIAALLAAMPAQAVPPPVEQFTANCAAPVYATDQLVCGDPELKAQDAAMAIALARLGRAPVNGLALWLEPQAEWFKRRSLCAFKTAHRQCALNAYAERMDVLGALTATAAPALSSYRCGNVRGMSSGDGTLVIWIDDKPAGAAVRRPERSEWQPYVRLDGRGAKLRITPSGGKPIRCVQQRP
jgi:uncharacterized protein